MASDTGNAWRAVPGHVDGCECRDCLSRPRPPAHNVELCPCHREANVMVLCDRHREIGRAGVRKARAQSSRGRHPSVLRAAS